MKKAIFILIISATTVSCKKDWSCVCDDRGDKVLAPIENSSKSNAKKRCEDYNNTYSNCQIQ